MSYLISINEKANTILHPDAVKLFPGFNVLSQEEILFIVLAYDYCSPYSGFVEADRIRRSSMHVWTDDTGSLILPKQKIKNAVEAYKGLQYNPKIELAKAYQRKIEELTGDIEGVGGADIKKTLDSINLLRKSIRELEQEVLAVYEEEGKMVGGGERSFLENMHKNRDLYKKVIQKR